ncbi:MAG: efflux RND transporter periplasmic adaptor subunit [Silvanigrellaceae bacterium]
MKKQRPFYKKPLFIVIAACLCAAIGMISWTRFNRLAKFEKDQNAKTVSVVRRDIRKDLLLTGKILPSSSIAVYSPVSGQLKQIHVQEGQKVDEGQLLFAVLQDTSGQKELEARQSEVQRTRIELQAAEENLDRRQNVKDLFSQAENEKAENDFERARLAFNTAREQLNLLENSLGLSGAANPDRKTKKKDSSRTSIIFVKAPRRGVVTFLNKAVGESVMATAESAEATGREVLIVSDTEQMMVRSKILESDLAIVKTGQPVQIKLDAFPEKSYRGKVNRISQQGVEDKAGGYTYFVTDILIESPDQDVRAQMNASVELVAAERKDVLALPANAVATLSGNSVVELPRSSASEPARYKSVKTGIMTDLWIEIEGDALKIGDKVLEIDFAKLDLKKLAEGRLGVENAVDSARGSIHQK